MLRSLCWTRAAPTPLLRRCLTTATASMATPFTHTVVSAMRRLYPESLADKSFDNTGLLLEAPSNPSRRAKPSVLLTIDLTRAVAEEAIKNRHSVIVAYHPIIFRGLKSLTFQDSQQSSLLRLAAEGISVYCPHTAVDTVPGGMADWLCDVVAGQQEPPGPGVRAVNVSPSKKPASSTRTNIAEHKTVPTYSEVHYPTPDPIAASIFPFAAVPHTRSVIHPSPAPSLSAANSSLPVAKYAESNTGAGRLLTLSKSLPLSAILSRIAHGVGTPAAMSVALPQTQRVDDMQIRSVGICPGSGTHVLGGCGADLLLTGELSHHDALAVTERGGAVVALAHSNSERGYLGAVMQPLLERELRREWAGGKGDGDEDVQVVLSQCDRDPFGMVVLQAPGE